MHMHRYHTLATPERNEVKRHDQGNQQQIVRATSKWNVSPSGARWSRWWVNKSTPRWRRANVMFHGCYFTCVMSLLRKLKQLSRGGVDRIMMLMWTSIMSTHIQTGGILQAQQSLSASLKQWASLHLSVEYQTSTLSSLDLGHSFIIKH